MMKVTKYYDKSLGIDVRTCGCPIEYHLADCPIIAPFNPHDYDVDDFYDNFVPEPQEFELEKWFDTEEEARAFCDTLALDYNLRHPKYGNGKWVVEYDI